MSIFDLPVTYDFLALYGQLANLNCTDIYEKLFLSFMTIGAKVFAGKKQDKKGSISRYDFIGL